MKQGLLPGSCLQPLEANHKSSSSPQLRAEVSKAPKPRVHPRPPRVTPKPRPRSLACSSEIKLIPLVGLTSSKGLMSNKPLNQHLNSLDEAPTRRFSGPDGVEDHLDGIQERLDDVQGHSRMAKTSEVLLNCIPSGEKNEVSITSCREPEMLNSRPKQNVIVFRSFQMCL